MSKFFMKNSAGKEDAMFTLSIISFFVVSFIVVMSLFDAVTLFGVTFDFAEPNVPLLTLYLGTCFSSYVFRRTTKDKLEHQERVGESAEEVENSDTYEEVIGVRNDLNEVIESFESVESEIEEVKNDLESIKEKENFLDKMNKDIVASLNETSGTLNNKIKEVTKEQNLKIAELQNTIQKLQNRLDEIKPKTPEIH